MEEANPRADLRVRIPEGHLREFAVWPAREGQAARLTLRELGRPWSRLALGKKPRIAIQDISQKGLQFAAIAPMSPDGERVYFAPAYVFLYLQLLDPWSAEEIKLLSLFFYAKAANVQQHERTTSLGLKFLRRGLPSGQDKALELVNVEKYGVGPLARWIDSLGRSPLAAGDLTDGGLDLDRLYEEIENALVRPAGTVEQNRA